MEVREKDKNNVEFTDDEYKALTTRRNENLKPAKFFIIGFTIFGVICVILFYLSSTGEKKGTDELDEFHSQQKMDDSSGTEEEDITKVVEDLKQSIIDIKKKIGEEVDNIFENFRIQLKKSALEMSEYRELQNEPIFPVFNDLYLDLRKTFEDYIYLGQIKIVIFARENIGNEINLDFEIESGKVSKVGILMLNEKYSMRNSIRGIEFEVNEKKGKLKIFLDNGISDYSIEKDDLFMIFVEFSGKVRNDMVGFYKAKTIGGKEILATQFEPTYARKAFPLFDKPVFKPIWKFTLKKPKELNAFFNTTPISLLPQSEKSDGKKKVGNMEMGNKKTEIEEEVRFKISPPMSSYLVAWVVGDLDSRSIFYKREDGSEVTVSIIASKERMEGTGFALEVALEALKFFESLFGVNYPLGKLDMVALPNFEAGAMENWGLITFRESDVLFFPESQSLGKNKNKSGEGKGTEIEKFKVELYKRRIFSVVAHELAHQWFGNLVSLETWGDLWLNEGFASYFEAYALSEVGTSFLNGFGSEDEEIKSFYKRSSLVNNNFSAMISDGIIKTNSLTMENIGDKDSKNIFNEISYDKGAAVISMAKELMGEETFLKGLKKYLEEKKFRGTNWKVLWDTLSEAIDGNDDEIKKSLHKEFKFGNLTEVMKNYNLLKGVPRISFEFEVKGKETLKIVFRQERFLYDRETAKVYNGNVSEEQNWNVPLEISVLYENGSKETFRFILSSKEGEIELQTGKSSNSAKVVLLNPRSLFYHLTTYSEEQIRSTVSFFDKLSVDEKTSFLFNVRMAAFGELLRFDSLKGLVDKSVLVNSKFVFDEIVSLFRKAANLHLKISGDKTKFKEFRKKELEFLKRVLEGVENKEVEGLEMSYLNFKIKSSSVMIEDSQNVKSVLERFSSLKTVTESEREDELGELELLCLLEHAPYRKELWEFYKEKVSINHSSLTNNNNNDNDKGEVGRGKLSPQKEVEILRALGSVSDEEYVVKALDFMLSDSVTTQNKIYVLGGVISKRENAEIAIKFVKENWNKIEKIFPDGKMINSFLSPFYLSSKEEDIVFLDKIVETNPSLNIEVEKIKETIKVFVGIIKFYSKQVNEIEDFLLNW